MSNGNEHDRDHSVFPEVITAQGEVLSSDDVAFAYSREGRRVIGMEYPNPVPLEPPLGYRPQPPLHELIREMVLRDISDRAAREGFETAAEADDFDVGDDDDFEVPSPHEVLFEPTNPWPASPQVEAAERAFVESVKKLREARGGGGAKPPSDKPKEEATSPPLKQDASPAPAKP